MAYLLDRKRRQGLMRIDRHGILFGRREEVDPPREYEVSLCREWLALTQHTKTGRMNSYTLKHIVERWAGHYIANGELLQAAIEMNLAIKYDPWRDGPNAWIGVGKRSVNKGNNILDKIGGPA